MERTKIEGTRLPTEKDSDGVGGNEIEEVGDNAKDTTGMSRREFLKKAGGFAIALNLGKSPSLKENGAFAEGAQLERKDRFVSAVDRYYQEAIKRLQLRAPLGSFNFPTEPDGITPLYADIVYARVDAISYEGGVGKGRLKEIHAAGRRDAEANRMNNRSLADYQDVLQKEEKAGLDALRRSSFFALAIAVGMNPERLDSFSQETVADLFEKGLEAFKIFEEESPRLKKQAEFLHTVAPEILMSVYERIREIQKLKEKIEGRKRFVANLEIFIPIYEQRKENARPYSWEERTLTEKLYDSRKKLAETKKSIPSLEEGFETLKGKEPLVAQLAAIGDENRHFVEKVQTLFLALGWFMLNFKDNNDIKKSAAKGELLARSKII